MKPDILLQSIPLFTAVLDGQSYRAVAAAHGLTRSAVERRVKACARLLAHEGVGMPINEAELAFVSRLRARRDVMIAALAAYRPAARPETPAGPVVSEDEIARMVSRLRARSAHPERDVALLYILFSTGARPLEIARLHVGDYLQADGCVRAASVMRADVAVNGAPRPLYFTSTKVNAVLDAYLAQRLRSKASGHHGAGNLFRGFAPGSCLFLTPAGRPFEIVRHGQGGQMRFLCRGILEAYRAIFRCIGIKGLSPLIVRRYVAARLHQRGATERQIGEALGIHSPRAVRALLLKTRQAMPSIMREFV